MHVKKLIIENNEIEKTMSIRHKPKQKIDLNSLLISLENPQDEKIEELNLLLGKCLDKMTDKLNLSFWQSVNFTYWNYVNLLKLAEKQYDANPDEFIKKIYNVANKNLRQSPVLKPIDENLSDEPVKPPKSWRDIPKSIQYAAGGVLALLVLGVTFKLIKDD